MEPNHTPVLLVHGGAWEIPPQVHADHIRGCRQAAAAGWTCLQAGASALDAVEAAVRCLEDDPTFDAGRGSFLNTAGQVEMDAIIMDGRDLNAGAVAAVQHVRHPVSLARLVMTQSEHVLLVGAGAQTFAQDCGLPLCPTQELLVGRELARWQDFQDGVGLRPLEYFTPSGTVGAVALDCAGNLAAATSTGGTPNKRPGRVGDTPLVGCGAYADNRSAAVSATGWGEALIKTVISKTACDLTTQGHTPQQAAGRAVSILAERTGGHGGLIVLDAQGRFGIAHNTSFIAFALISTGGLVKSGIEYHPKSG